MQMADRSRGVKEQSERLEEWTEHELDYLWLGVRRHGCSNWDSLLRDPRLKFSESKTAAHLSTKWEEELWKALETNHQTVDTHKHNNNIPLPQQSTGPTGDDLSHLPHWLRPVVLAQRAAAAAAAAAAGNPAPHNSENNGDSSSSGKAISDQRG